MMFDSADVDLSGTAGLLRAFAFETEARASKELGLDSPHSITHVSPLLLQILSRTPAERGEVLRSSLLQELRTLQDRPAPMVMLPIDDVESRHGEALLHLVGGVRATGLRDSSLDLISNAEFEHASSACLKALGWVREVWPQAAVEMQLLVREVAVMSGDDFSASDPAVFGCIFASVAALSSGPRAYETLLHETGHHWFYLATRAGAFLDNPDHAVQHPLRSDPRPLSGALSAAVSLWRMVTGLTLLAEYSALSDSERREARSLLERDESLLWQTLSLLQNEGEWTERGCRLFASMQEAHNFDLEGRQLA